MAPPRWSLVGRRHRPRAERPVFTGGDATGDEELPERRVPGPPPGLSLPSRTFEPPPETGCVTRPICEYEGAGLGGGLGAYVPYPGPCRARHLSLKTRWGCQDQAEPRCDRRREDAIEQAGRVAPSASAARPSGGLAGPSSAWWPVAPRGLPGPLRASTPRVCSNAARSAEPAERYQGQVAAASSLLIHRSRCDAVPTRVGRTPASRRMRARRGILARPHEHRSVAHDRQVQHPAAGDRPWSQGAVGNSMRRVSTLSARISVRSPCARVFRPVFTKRRCLPVRHRW
jgi:hypothetical protein